MPAVFAAEDFSKVTTALLVSLLKSIDVILGNQSKIWEEKRMLSHTFHKTWEMISMIKDEENLWDEREELVELFLSRGGRNAGYLNPIEHRQSHREEGDKR